MLIMALLLSLLIGMGFLTGEILDFDSKFRLDERHPQCKRSLRTGWMTTDLMNYEGTSEFDYYRNEYLTEKRHSGETFLFQG